MPDGFDGGVFGEVFDELEGGFVDGFVAFGVAFDVGKEDFGVCDVEWGALGGVGGDGIAEFAGEG